MKKRLGKSLSVAARMSLLRSNEVNEIGTKLTEMGADGLLDGGFCILPLDENLDQYFSPKFRFITGYEKGELKSNVDFYNILPIDILKEFRDNLKKSEDFFQSFVVETKNRSHVLLYCDVSLIKNKIIIIGANKVIKK